MTTGTEPHDPYAVLRLPEFRAVLLGRMFLTLAVQMQAVIVSWQIYSLTRDPLALGLIGLAEAIPSIAVSLYAGHLADIVSRRRIILICTTVIIAAAAALLSFSLAAFPLQGQDLVWAIYGVIFVIGIARGFFSPALHAFTTQVVPSNQFANMSTWSSTVWHFANVAGPAIGGLIFGFAGSTVAYSIVTILLVIGLGLFLLTTDRPVPTGIVFENMKDSLLAGIRFVFNNQVILGALSLDLFAVLFGGAVALLPIFASDILRVGPQGLGILRAAPSAGAVIMAVYLAHYPLRAGAGKQLLWAVSGFGICMIVFGISESFILSLVVLAVSGALDNISVVIRHTVVQAMTPPSMRGRVTAVNGIFIGSSNEIGAFESGAAARLLGVVPSVIVGGLLTQLVVIIAAIRAPRLRALDMSNPASDRV